MTHPRRWSCLAALIVAAASAAPAQPPREKDLLPPPPEKNPEKGTERPRKPDSRPDPTNLVDLRPKFEKGQVIRFKLEMSSGTRQTPVKGQQPARQPTPRPSQRQPSSTPDTGATDMNSVVEMGLKLKVADVSAESGATVDMTIDTLRVSIKGQGVTADYDSTKPPKPGADDMTASLFKSIVGTTMTLKVDHEGNITSVTGGEALAALGQMGGSSGGGGGGAGQLFGSIFSLHKVTGKAAVGESWENKDTIESPLLGRFKMITKHTLARLSGRDAYIDLHGRLESDSEAPGQEPFTIKSSRHDGQYVWDTGAGMLRQMTSTMSNEIQARPGEEETLTRSESRLSISRQK